MRNAELEEAQAGVKIAGRNINNLKYADTQPLWQKVKRNQKASWWKWKSEKVGLKLNIQKTKIMTSGPITSWQIDWETVETVIDIILVLTPKSVQMMMAAMKLKEAYSLEEKLWPI